MSKAYNRVRWDFLRVVLIKVGLPCRMVELIISCVNTVSYQVLFNGAPLSLFKPNCGLRQGDPLSPYLFVLCMEALSSNLLCAQNNGSLKGISQIMNEDKQGILFSSSTTLKKARRGLTNLKIKGNKGLGKYLGLPTEFQGSKRELFKGLVDILMKRISSWNGIFLSPAGRLTLISSALSNLFNYFLSVFKIPQVVGTADQAIAVGKKESIIPMELTIALTTDSVLWIRESNPVCLVGAIRNCDYVSIMVDAGWRGIDNAGVGWVGVLGSGERCCSMDKKIRAESSLQAEGLEVQMVLLWAREQGIRHLEMKKVYTYIAQRYVIVADQHYFK
ncbi:uncharacterized protein LOC141600738 [Silene latifolia]|uniref:uncharacterized protein LOC141600738 n=1 Tax=Silene latifolia TaxID=37657 RepID=UPI003D7826F1